MKSNSQKQSIEPAKKGMSRRGALKLAAATPFAFSIIGCGGSGNSGDWVQSVSYRWTSTLLDAVSNGTLGPPMTARAIGIVGTAIFDAWACYDAVAVGTRLGGTLRRPAAERTRANKEKAISYAAYRVLVDLYPAQVARFDDMMADLGYNPADNSTDTSTPQGIGNTVAAALITFRHNDGSNQLGGYADTTGYVPVNTPTNVVDPRFWQQLQFANGASPSYIAPHWGNVIPFALTSASIVRPGAYPTFGSPAYLEQIQQVIDVTAGLNDRKKVIAEYWADGPRTVLPPGHWQIFGQVISERDRHTLDQDVKLFFMLGNAVFDAGIACWECKRFYNSSRPITAIRHFMNGVQIPSFLGPGLGIGMVDGSQWHPYQSVNFVTPPFPEYTSGHSTFSASSAEILKRFTGSDRFEHGVTLPAGWSAFETGVPSTSVTLSWSTFTDAANEAGSSRLYGGIHIRAGDIEARICGRQVGERVWDACNSYIDGTATSIRPGG